MWVGGGVWGARVGGSCAHGAAAAAESGRAPDPDDGGARGGGGAPSADLAQCHRRGAAARARYGCTLHPTPYTLHPTPKTGVYVFMIRLISGRRALSLLRRVRASAWCTHAALHLHAAAPPPEPDTRKPKYETRNPEPETLVHAAAPQPQTRDLNPPTPSPTQTDAARSERRGCSSGEERARRACHAVFLRVCGAHAGAAGPPVRCSCGARGWRRRGGRGAAGCRGRGMVGRGRGSAQLPAIPRVSTVGAGGGGGGG